MGKQREMIENLKVKEHVDRSTESMILFIGCDWICCITFTFNIYANTCYNCREDGVCSGSKILEVFASTKIQQISKWLRRSSRKCHASHEILQLVLRLGQEHGGMPEQIQDARRAEILSPGYIP